MYIKNSKTKQYSTYIYVYPRIGIYMFRMSFYIYMNSWIVYICGRMHFSKCIRMVSRWLYNNSKFIDWAPFGDWDRSDSACLNSYVNWNFRSHANVDIYKWIKVYTGRYIIYTTPIYFNANKKKLHTSLGTKLEGKLITWLPPCAFKQKTYLVNVIIIHIKMWSLWGWILICW